MGFALFVGEIFGLGQNRDRCITGDPSASRGGLSADGRREGDRLTKQPGY